MKKIAFLFAGQGAQYAGMGRELYHASPAARAVFDCGESLRPGTLAQCFGESGDALHQTANTQPCLFLMDLACAAALDEAGIKAQGAAGFSLGEIPALCHCGLLPFEDAFRLVCRRGELMQEAAQKHPGAMAAVLRLDAETVTALAQPYSNVFPVNFNCPGQTVVSGEPEQLAAFEKDVAARRGRTLRLNVSGGFHSPFMEEAGRGLQEYLEGISFQSPSLPLYANATARPYDDPKALLARQVKEPVLWQSTIEAMKQDGFAAFIEVGAGQTLTGLMGKIGGAELSLHVEDPASLAQALEALGDWKGASGC